MLIDKVVCYLILGIVTTIPLVFGAAHPILLGSYVFLMLVGCGGWLVFSVKSEEIARPNFWVAVPLILIGYIIFQSIPLPLELVEFFSPGRADRIKVVNELAETNIYWVPLSENGLTGLYKSFFYLGVFLYYFSLKRLLAIENNFLLKLIVCLVAVGSFEALYGILQFVKPHIGLLWLTLKSRAAHGTIIYKNQYASLLNMIWPLAITVGAFYLSRKKRHAVPQRSSETVESHLDLFTSNKMQAPLFLFGSLGMILAVILSLSRGGILSMLLVGMLLIVLLPFSFRSKMIFLSVFCVVVFGYVALLGVDTIINRFGSLGAAGANRLELYSGSLPMLIDNWTTGVGIGGYSLLSPVYLKGFPVSIHFDRVHNEYLELMIELGIPVSILLFCWIFGGIINLSVRLVGSLKYNKFKGDMTILGAAAFCGIIGFAAHGIVDFGWRLPVNLLYSVTLLAILIHSLSSRSLFRQNPS